MSSGLILLFGSLYPAGCHFLNGDGSVRFFKENISTGFFGFLSTRAANEVVSAEQF